MGEKYSYNIKLIFNLSDDDQKIIKEILKKGQTSVRVFKRAQILWHFNQGNTSPDIAKFIGVTAETVRRVGWNYVNKGLERALYDLPHPGAIKKLTQKQETHIVALVCSDPPAGYSRWSIRLITEEVIKRKIVDSIGRETIRIILKNHGIKPWREKMWCVTELTDEYIKRMEDILDLYNKEYNSKEPTVCLDEKPVQLLEDLRNPDESDKKDAIKKKDHQYKRKGTANVFCGVEPLTGQYFNHVTVNKKSAEFAKEINKIAKAYPDADTIHLVMDNYCTHTQKALVDYYGKEKGNEIWNRFTIHYTPKNASWLDQAEIAIGLYSRQCLGKDRIPDIETLREKTKAWNRAINKKKVKINWGFTIEKDRNIFKY